VPTSSPAPASSDTTEPRLLRGKARMIQIAREAEIERKAEEAKLIADLGREPSGAERLLVESAAALTVRARRLRLQGHGSAAEDTTRLLIRTLGKLGIAEGKAAPPKSFEERLADHIAARRAADAASGGEVAPDKDQRTSDGADRHGEAPR